MQAPVAPASSEERLSVGTWPMQNTVSTTDQSRPTHFRSRKQPHILVIGNVYATFPKDANACSSALQTAMREAVAVAAAAASQSDGILGHMDYSDGNVSLSIMGCNASTGHAEHAEDHQSNVSYTLEVPSKRIGDALQVVVAETPLAFGSLLASQFQSLTGVAIRNVTASDVKVQVVLENAGVRTSYFACMLTPLLALATQQWTTAKEERTWQLVGAQSVRHT